MHSRSNTRNLKQKNLKVQILKNPMNTVLTMSFGYQKKPDGHICKLRLSSHPLVRPSMKR